VDRRIVLALVFLVMIITFSLVNGEIYQGEMESAMHYHDGYQIEPANSYTSHVPITINNNANFSSQGWPGSGISGDPYVIEGLEIDAFGVCINITNTTVYFEVRNCLIRSGSVSSFDGIVLDNATHGSIIGCIVERHYMGITVQDSPGCILTHNTASNNSRNGFYLLRSSGCTLTHNTAFNNDGNGFSLEHLANCTLTNNTASNNRYGFIGYDSSNCILSENTASSNYLSGIHMGGMNITLTNNTVARNGSCGIYLMGDNSNLTYNTASYNGLGINLQLSDNCTLTYNTAFSNFGDNDNDGGFYMYWGFSCSLSHNTAYNNSKNGFYLSSMSNCTFTNNTSYANYKYGIRLGYGTNNTLYLNKIGDNGGMGYYRDSDARDDAGENNWDDGVSQGNYWLDYNGTGTYTIPGTAGSVDHYPFVWVPETTSTTGGGENTILFLVIICSGIAVVVIVAAIYMRKRTDDSE